ncbi:MAG: DUF2075 domain-containing protein [Rubrivivax sp.]|nr:DUF2075 domain-containing protein [Rubrivivax sp.]
MPPPGNLQTPTASQRASYAAGIADFVRADPLAVLGALVHGQGGEVGVAQRAAWQTQIGILQASVPRHPAGIICFEFVIPRIGKRADNILLIGDHVVVIEFKVGSVDHELDAKKQVMDYALDLKNFHLGSHSATIIPVLVATHAHVAAAWPAAGPDRGVCPVVLASEASLAVVLREVATRAVEGILSHLDWLASGYRPTPTIVEAAQALYRGHGVAEITHSEAGADNLGATTLALTEAIERARAQNEKIICLVSGVPGAGKTLAGLNLVCQRQRVDTQDAEHAVFLSGNGPLVRVLQEALARDEVSRATRNGAKVSKQDAHRRAVTFVQNIHHFRDASLADPNPPVERVVVFDEAQRAWNRDQASKFMRQKRNRADFDASEPEFLIGVMDRHRGWAVIVCLIGGGQEINTGEAGMGEWLRALRDRYPTWRVYLPNQPDSTAFLASSELEPLEDRVTRHAAMHLGVSLRSFRSERLSAAVSALMSGDSRRAAHELSTVLPKFPIMITRSLADAKSWVRGKARGTERFGVLASSGGKRLKPMGINMDAQIDPCVWFLNPESDVRSSYYLEDAASEFDVQGLELDWTIVVWDGDLVHHASGWRYRAFRGTRWQEIRDEAAQRYRLNAYRVLLTRARQGTVIVIPAGDELDPTRQPAYYDPTWAYLRSVGLPQLPEIRSGRQ